MRENHGGYGVEMTREEIAAFLTTVGDGVLSLSDGDPYGIPVSTAYDRAEHRLLFQFLFGKRSRKRDLIEASNRVSFTAYRWHAPDDWRSVIVTGTLHELDWENADRERITRLFADQAHVASLAVFDEPISELEAVWYELDITDATGRDSPTLPEGWADSLDESDTQ